MKKIAFITSGGDAPGMNTAIRAIVKTALYHKIQPIGFYNGFQGLVDGSYKEFTYRDVNNIVFTGGTVIGSSRSKEFETVEGRKKAFDNLKKLNIDSLIIIGGDGSFTGGCVFAEEFGINVVGVPATIDNDIFGTDYTIGFDTALNTVVESIDKIRDTANSHHRMFFVEVMGRNSGFIALHAAIATGAEMVFIPEEKINIETLAEEIMHMNKGERGTIFIVAEGEESGGVNGVCQRLMPYIKGFDVRTTVLGHVQRGGRPTGKDRVLSTRLSTAAVEALINNKSSIMIGFSNNKVTEVSLQEAISKKHKIEKEDVKMLKKLITLIG